MFHGEMEESSDSIELPDCEHDGLLEMLRYIYTDQANLTSDNVIQVLYLANKYVLNTLAEKCIEYLVNNLETLDAFFILKTAKMSGQKDLEEKCWEVIDNNTEEALKSKEFTTIERSLLKELVKRDSLNIKEVDLFKAVDNWAAEQGTGPRTKWGG